MLTNSKFLKLIRRLGMPDAHVLGHLELLWMSAHQNAAEFDSIEDIEIVSRWVGEKGKFGDALAMNRFIDKTDSGWVIHDYEDHAPEYVKTRKRVAKFRTKQQSCNVTVTLPKRISTLQGVSSNAPALPSQALPSQAKPSLKTDSSVGQSDNHALLDFQTEIIDAWKASAEKHGHPGCRFADKKAQKNIKARFSDLVWTEHWREALDRLDWNPWRINEGKQYTTLEWFTREDTVSKLMEMTGRVSNHKQVKGYEPWGEEATQGAPF